MNVREILNRVCRAIGEEQIDCSISSLEDDNHILLLEFLNQFKERVEEAHNWRSLTGSFQAALSANSNAATILGASSRARLVRIHDQRLNGLIPLAYDITDATRPIPLQEMDGSMIRHRILIDGAGANVEPVYFSLQPVEPDTMTALVHPRPTTDRTLAFVMVNPQGYLDVGDLETELQIPHKALVLGTIWQALQERGEELGQGSMFSEEQYRKALDAEIASDMGEQGEQDLVVV